MRRRTAPLIGSVVLLVAVATGSAAIALSSRTRASAQGAPLARVGAIYFDGWACPLTNFHFKGLLGSKFAGRRPLSGWRDDTPQAIGTAAMGTRRRDRLLLVRLVPGGHRSLSQRRARQLPEAARPRRCRLRPAVREPRSLRRLCGRVAFARRAVGDAGFP